MKEDIMSNNYYSNRDAWKERELSASCGGLGFAGSYYDCEEPQNLNDQSEFSRVPSQTSTQQYLGYLGLSSGTVPNSNRFVTRSTESFRNTEATTEVN